MKQNILGLFLHLVKAYLLKTIYLQVLFTANDLEKCFYLFMRMNEWNFYEKGWYLRQTLILGLNTLSLYENHQQKLGIILLK